MSDLLHNTLSVVLAGGTGTRLQPLSQDRAKPAVPFGGKYRIIDFTLSNCLHSGLRRMLVLTQYKSHSLQKHLRDGWSVFNPELGEYITPIPPQMRTGGNWYEGTADAIYQNLYLLERSGAKYVLILSADHIYRMDYLPMLEQHLATNADVTVACMQVPLAEASRFGLMHLDEGQRVKGFSEKPHNPQAWAVDEKHALGSMGIYVFSMDVLLQEVEKDHLDEHSSHDFGKDIIPRLIDTHNSFGYRFGGSEGRVTQDKYWRDVGTVDAYYEANFDLLEPVPPMNLYQKDWPVRTYTTQNPPARTAQGDMGNEGVFINSIVSAGSVIVGASVQNSILFDNVMVDDEATVYGSILFNGVHVGKGAQLQNCIVDKHVRIPDGEIIGFEPEKDASRFTVSEKGVVVIPKGYAF